MVIYGLHLPHTFITLNDAELVSLNPIVHTISPHTIREAFTSYDPELYIPLTLLSYQIDWWLGNGSAFVFHIDNLILHTINALLIVWLTFLFSRNRWIGLLCGLMFLVHPINTETVLWVNARKDLLSTFFGRLTLIAYVTYVFDQRKGMLHVSRGFFLFALLAKVKVIFLPFIMLLIDWKEQRPFRWTVLREKIPHFGFSVLFGIIALYGKEGALLSSTLSSKLYLSVRSSLFYLQHFVVPVDYSVYYPYEHPTIPFSEDFFGPLLVLILVGLCAALTLRWTRDIVFGLLIYFIGIIPSFTNLVRGNDVFLGSDRYAYTALVGITYATASLFVLVKEHCEEHVRMQLRFASRSLWVVVLIILSTFSYRQSFVWASSESLYRHAIAVYPEYYLPYYDLGVDRDEQGLVPEAITLYEHSLALAPVFPLAHLNLGRIYYHQGMRSKAREQFILALKSDPHFAMASFNLGVMDGEEKRFDDAKAYYEKAITDNPALLDARLNLAAMQADRGENKEAVEQLKKTLALDPNNTRTWSLIGHFVQKGILQRP